MSIHARTREGEPGAKAGFAHPMGTCARCPAACGVYSACSFAHLGLLELLLRHRLGPGLVGHRTATCLR